MSGKHKKKKKIETLFTKAVEFNKKDGANHTWNAHRLSEECVELTKELISFCHRPHKTTQNAIEEELGDVILRSELFLRSGAVDIERVKQRVKDKLEKYEGYIDKGERDLV